MSRMQMDTNPSSPMKRNRNRNRKRKLNMMMEDDDIDMHPTQCQKTAISRPRQTCKRARFHSISLKMYVCSLKFILKFLQFHACQIQKNINIIGPQNN